MGRSHSHTDKPENNVYIRETGFLKDQYDKNAHYTNQMNWANHTR